MRAIIKAVALLVSGTTFSMIAAFVFSSPSIERTEVELRCEGAGGIIINVEGKDYGVNGKAGPNYPPIRSLWTALPQAKIDRLVVHGLMLCDWHTAAIK